MTNQIVNQYIPDTVSPPGDTLEELLNERGMSQAQLAERTGRSKKFINEIIQGKAPISADTALQIELVLGIPARFWLAREQLYREYIARRDEETNLAHDTNWLQNVPVKEMAQLGWIKRYHPLVEQLREVLRFFGIASINQWESTTANFRRSAAFTSNPIAISAWLRRGELEAHELACAPFDETRFQDTLRRIRLLTTETPAVFVPRLIEWCASAGVAVVFVPELPHTHVCGATRWLSTTRALIMLSLRYKTNDHLWFTFFHEAGHIMKHGKRDTFFEEEQINNDEKEQEANRFAADFLIPPTEWEQFITTIDYRSKVNISTFAQKIGIAPGIVVGRLQREHKIPHRNCNDLKQRIKWV